MYVFPMKDQLKDLTGPMKHPVKKEKTFYIYQCQYLSPFTSNKGLSVGRQTGVQDVDGPAKLLHRRLQTKAASISTSKFPCKQLHHLVSLRFLSLILTRTNRPEPPLPVLPEERRNHQPGPETAPSHGSIPSNPPVPSSTPLEKLEGPTAWPPPIDHAWRTEHAHV